MLNWLYDKRALFVLQLLLCGGLYAITRNLELLAGVLAVLILLEFGFASHCYDRITNPLPHCLKYSACYNSRGRTRQINNFASQASSPWEQIGQKLRKVGEKKDKNRYHEQVGQEIMLKENVIFAKDDEF